MPNANPGLQELGGVRIMTCARVVQQRVIIIARECTPQGVWGHRKFWPSQSVSGAF